MTKQILPAAILCTPAENMSRLHPHRPFDYVEGDYPPGFKWRSELNDGDVRGLQKKGGKMVVLSPDYQFADMEDARKQSKAPTMPRDTKPHNNAKSE